MMSCNKVARRLACNVQYSLTSCRCAACCTPACCARVANPAMPMLSVAPEGTLSHGRCVLSFKRGAFVAGVPVVPFVLRYKLTPHNPAWTIIKPFWHVVSPSYQA